jgi:hypothetical protein
VEVLAISARIFGLATTPTPSRYLMSLVIPIRKCLRASSLSTNP